MKKYKLKQWYPSLPKDWKVGVVIKQSGIECLSNIYCPLNSLTHQTLNKGEVENSPDYWEEVVEKDYEILGVLHLKTDTTFTLLEGQAVWGSDVDIIQIRRPSDGEVFNLGDVVTSELICWENATIESFTTEGNCALVKYNTGGQFVTEYLRNIKKRLPVITTKDGITLYEGDTWYGLHEFSKEGIITRTTRESDPKGRYENLTLFSTMEAAEDYVLMNKPCLSIQDVLNFIPEGVTAITKHNLCNKLKTLVKTP